MRAWMLFVVLFDERVGLLDYFNPSDSLIFFDELTRCAEQGKLTETEFSESMKQRLAMGYILPGQMNGLFTEKEIVAKLGKYSCIALAALDNKANGLHQLGSYGIHCQSVSPYNNSFELLIKDLKRYKKTATESFFYPVQGQGQSGFQRISQTRESHAFILKTTTMSF